MVKIKITSIGKLHYRELYETSKRFEMMISRFAKVKIIELSESKKPFPKNLEEEQEMIMKTLESEFLIVLDKDGKLMSSEEFAELIKANIDLGRNICFVIGGHQGVSEQLKSKADAVISFSKMTFGHNIFRIMLLEQIYRAFSIIFGTGYHK
ncbi:MAG: 23S rRNA (pseudouridine(1915)-N(3))-methyltransferase RlmH [Brevinematia bacterium]